MNGAAQKVDNTLPRLQYADDAVIVSSSEKGSQAVLNLFVAWCNWCEMVLHLDKCCSFGNEWHPAGSGS